MTEKTSHEIVVDDALRWARERIADTHWHAVREEHEALTLLVAEVETLRSEVARLRSLIECQICESRPCQCGAIAAKLETLMKGFAP